MANVTFLAPAYSETNFAFINVADSTHVEVQIGNILDTYYGSFVYGPDGSMIGGTLTGFQESYRGVLGLNMTDINLPAVPVANAILHGDMTTAVTLLFSGNDSVMGSVYGEAIIGGAGNDVVIALDGNDSVAGGDGNDDLNGNVGADIVVGEAGSDIVRGGKDNDSIFGGDGDDWHVNGNIGNDSVSGGNGADTVYGGQDNDTLHGDAGNDLLSGDLGNDILYGDAGADRFAISKGGGVDWVADFHAFEGDKIQLAPGTAYTVANSGGQVMIDLGGGDQLGLAGVAAGSFSADWIVFG